MPHQCTNCGRTFADGSKEMLSGCPDCGGNKFQFAPTAAAAAESFEGSGSSESADTPGSGSAGSTTSGSTATAGGAESPDSESVTTRAAETVRDWVSSDSSGAEDGPDDETVAQPRPDDPAPSTESNTPWPSSGRADAIESDTSTDGEFTECPETARRPEDRAGASSETVDDESVDGERSPRRSDGPTTTLADDENSAQADARSEFVPADDLPAHADGFDPADTTAGKPVDAPPATDGDDVPPEHGRVVSEPSGDRPSIEDLREELNEQFESIKIVRPGQYELNLMELYNRDEYIISLQEDGRYVIDVPDSWRDGDDSDE